MTIFEPDTASVCTRNSISDVTFHDSTSFIVTIEPSPPDGFPFTFIEKNINRGTMGKESLLLKLRDGVKIPEQPFNEDWLVFAVMGSIFLYAMISIISRRFFHDMRRFFLFSGVGDPASRDMPALFHWQSTIINTVTFFNIALFAYCAADYFKLIPYIFHGIIFWFLCTVIVIAAVTLRHLVCHITGSISDQIEVFNEYIITIYLSYRYAAVLLFIISLMILYTDLFNTKSLFLSGLAVIGLAYLIRITRLLMIFIRKSISIFYLILYLCALEFLPVLILLKYFTDLF
jgi:hypothetical protein